MIRVLGLSSRVAPRRAKEPLPRRRRRKGRTRVAAPRAIHPLLVPVDVATPQEHPPGVDEPISPPLPPSVTSAPSGPASNPPPDPAPPASRLVGLPASITPTPPASPSPPPSAPPASVPASRPVPPTPPSTPGHWATGCATSAAQAPLPTGIVNAVVVGYVVRILLALSPTMNTEWQPTASDTDAVYVAFRVGSPSSRVIGVQVPSTTAFKSAGAPPVGSFH